MDSLIAAAGRALAVGDALGALKRVALRDDPPALALRGIAMAQLGDYPRARELLRRAARGFGAREELARARCLVAEAEVALAMRDLGGSPRPLADAAVALQVRADHANALQARLIALRRLLLLGRLEEAASALAQLDISGQPPSLVAVAELAAAELALRSLHTASARAALDRALAAAERARVPALVAEVSDARAALDRAAARIVHAGHEQPLRLEQVEALLASGALVVDACRRGLRAGERWQALARRPVLFALLRALAEGWPGDVDRGDLIANVFRTRHPDETHRARLRVELGRLRALIAPLADIEATARGFRLAPHDERAVVVLMPPIDGDQASLLALLGDGAAWSTSALALALGDSQRTVQRALVELEAAAQVRSIGRARAQRWLAPSLVGFTTILLLPAALPPG
ncbi:MULTISPECIES: helix-turn-helix domain-containing protein [unclassified Lysobacter]|uniref:helix-turn-helix domain-containing protein n=1 Tax=unclassified Lysobacter TaxID=2635362 RepID=UPI001BEB83EA|nr:MULTISPECIES: helix-turn-helix domain-containing protein [unclassified Lysobacter]MBT2747701.1 helix-turn-helix domain-containing protein [Lysobacter sp. ISL-42]MBT2754019.1 helix-turn-helix domain-containing protein [Lysobacter sp. ISL-50]MBT2779702.1 helix-turn-helix domain-containing protein [Lysobacter sp. ISL-54]MBT2780119.1 helix-turn-helix domain-containing protein [Lysobacter sp. ISL-52]